jgi:holo-[acyl-carrier protein] synthase
MILGVGIDAVRIDRLKEWESKPNVLDRFFHPRELEQILKRGKGSLQSLAARFAAKEAYGKALGTGLKGVSLREIRIDTDDLGKPHLLVYGKAKNQLEALGGKYLFVSLTHETEHAIAVVVIEGE